MTSTVPFQYLRHCLTVPVRVGDTQARFIVDTGIGVNLVSDALAAALGCVPSGPPFTGQRMSGQEVSAPMTSVAEIQLGELAVRDVPVGIFDLSAMAGLEGIDGFLSLQFFRSVPVTVDYPAGAIVIEDERSLARRVAAGTVVGADVKDNGPATDVHLSLRLPSGRVISVEVDAGSDELILHSALAADAGVDLTDPGVRTIEGQDETGHTFTRYFSTVRGDVSLADAPRICQADPDVMFQEIIYDGLVGDRFLRNFIVTYDLLRSRMVFAVPPRA